MKLRKRKKSEARDKPEARDKRAAPAAGAGDPSVETDRLAADAGGPSPRGSASSNGSASATAREISMRDEAEAVEAMYQAALVRTEVAEAREQAIAKQAAAVEELGQFVSGRIAVLEAREQAAAERDAIANGRDRAAVERDQIANGRERALGERALGERTPVAAPPRPDEGRDGDEREIELADLEARLHRAHLDALTGVFRREMGRLALRNEIERARRGDGRFVLAFIDVDGLKGVNDRDGHPAGDRVLRMLAATLRANLRSYDPIVRFGGDEFVCGIASIDVGEVEHRIGVIDQSLRNATGVGITAGLATLSGDEGLDELTTRADEALLEAKRSRDD